MSKAHFPTFSGFSVLTSLRFFVWSTCPIVGSGLVSRVLELSHPVGRIDRLEAILWLFTPFVMTLTVRFLRGSVGSVSLSFVSSGFEYLGVSSER